jgi:ribosomal protein L5
MARLHEFYKEKVVPGLVEKFGYKSVMEVPRITKITLNMGRRLLAKSRLSRRHARLSLASRFVRATRSARWLRCAARPCTNFSIVS